jgi:hypothetical protein
MHASVELLESRLLWSAALSGSFAGASPAGLSPARANRVALRIANTGDQLAGGRIRVNLYASTNPVPGGGEMLLATNQRILQLRPGRSLNVPLRFTQPSGLPDGSYFLLAQVSSDAGIDSGGFIASPAPVAVRQPFIDLTGQFSSFPVGAVDVSNGGNDVLAVRVSNQGNTPAAGPLAVSFFASTDATPDPADTLIGVAARNLRIRPGGSQEFVAPITFPSGFAVGNYHVFAQVDSAQAFAEGNEDNNTVAAPRQLIAANLPAPPVIDQRERHHRHHQDVVIVESGGFIGGAFFVGDVVNAPESGGDPFVPDNSPPPDIGMDQPPADSTPPPDTQPVDTSGGWDVGSSAGSDF